MDVTWSDRKAKLNLVKHKISFEDASLVFIDPNAVDDLDVDVPHEDRWKRIGIAKGRVLLIVYTETAHGVRIISARKATSDEADSYFGRR